MATAAFGLLGCGALYPELSPPIRSVPANATKEPPPPDDLLYVRFAKAEIPKRTRDGRAWDSVGNALPDVFAKLFVDGKEIIFTPTQSNTLSPTWPNQRKANYRIPRGARVRVELWDANPINNHPICGYDIADLHEQVSAESNYQILCNSGARIELAVQPAHAKYGLGFSYELRSSDIFVTRVLTESPAGRAELRVGDQLLKIQGKDVKVFEDGQAQSLINANARTGIKLTVKRAAGKVEEFELKEGPIYPLPEEDVPIE